MNLKVGKYVCLLVFTVVYVYLVQYMVENKFAKVNLIFNQGIFSFHRIWIQLLLYFVNYNTKEFAPGEARTHGLQIMRLTRCLLRYGGTVEQSSKGIMLNLLLIKVESSMIVVCWYNWKKWIKQCVSRESNPGQLLGRQLCSPLYHWRLIYSGVGAENAKKTLLSKCLMFVLYTNLKFNL